MTEKELRELDAEVHEKVMGLKCRWVRTSFGDTPPELRDLITPSASVPWYSTEIEAAWKVFEKLCTQVPGVSIRSWFENGIQGWLVTVDCNVSSPFDGATAGKKRFFDASPEVAICRASLAVVSQKQTHAEE